MTLPISPAARVAAGSSSSSRPLFQAADALLIHLTKGDSIDAPKLRAAMTDACGASDSEGGWDWKSAYDACEAAIILFLRKFAPAMHARAGSRHAFLAMLEKLARHLPSHTRRSEESQALQQFSTPIGLGFAASVAAALVPEDVVLEPSAGTGLLAIFAELAGATLILNELAQTRAGLLATLFPDVGVTQYDAAHIDDHLDCALRPSVVLMNPPFSVAAHVEGRVADAAFRHVASALARLADGGRLVAITGADLSPEHPDWREGFVRLQETARIVFTAAIDGSVYARHGTATDTRLLVVDKNPATNAQAFPASPGLAPDVTTLLGWVTEHLPPRAPVVASSTPCLTAASIPRKPVLARSAFPSRPISVAPDAEALVYEAIDWKPAEHARLTDTLYESYAVQSLRMPGAAPHPTKLVQSAAMASVAPPKPSYRPHLPTSTLRDGLLSDAQLESVIYAGEAHSAFLAGSWTVDETFDVVSAASDDTKDAVQFRRGWMLGDGTGAGKGRQVAGILLDNWCQGRTRAVWFSKSNKLIEDAQRDWSALDQERLLITPLSRFRQGAPIRLDHGILFATYATLRSDAKENKASRVEQIVDWLGRDFDGAIVFDESHALANAASTVGERGESAPSQQGRAGLRLQHALPNARMQEENKHLSPEQARHLTLHGANQNEDGTWSWKFDNAVRLGGGPAGLPPEEQREIWEQITAPVLLIRGTESWASDPAKDGRIKHFRNARLVNIEGAGHWSHHDRFGVFMDTVEKFLAE